MNPTDSKLSRREFLAQAATGLAGKSERLLIDTQLEVRAIDPKFPFHHPEHPLHKYPDRFVAHGLINPEDPNVVEAALLVEGAWLSGHALQPSVPSELHLALFESALSAVARSGKTGCRIKVGPPASVSPLKPSDS